MERSIVQLFYHNKWPTQSRYYVYVYMANKIADIDIFIYDKNTRSGKKECMNKFTGRYIQNENYYLVVYSGTDIIIQGLPSKTYV